MPVADALVLRMSVKGREYLRAQGSWADPNIGQLILATKDKDGYELRTVGRYGVRFVAMKGRQEGNASLEGQLFVGIIQDQGFQKADNVVSYILTNINLNNWLQRKQSVVWSLIKSRQGYFLNTLTYT